ncbi:MAG: hypothetical protein ACJAWL_001591 [Motiliproteus sp.]|jgi:hypothetical protein
MRRSTLLTTLLLATTAAASNAAEPELLLKGGSKAVVAYKTDFSVQVVDRVTDGCLLHPQSLQKTMETKLKASGYSIIPDTPKALKDTIVISVLGHASGEACMVNVEVWLNHWLVANVPYATNVESGLQTYISTSHDLGQQIFYITKDKTAARTRHAVESLADDLIEDLQQSRRYADKNFPLLGQEYQRLGNQVSATQSIEEKPQGS